MNQLAFTLHESGPEPDARNAWTVWVTRPGDHWHTAPPEPPDGHRCRPTAEYQDVRDDGGDLYFRGACLTCAWRGAPRDDENAAVEDAHDHTHPEWHALPVVDSPPDLGNVTRRDAERRRQRWLDRIAQQYPPDWFVTGGPIRTRRSPHGTRHVPGRAPGGGYDLCGDVRERRLIPNVSEPAPRSVA
ncbi:MAG: DUF6349 family protein [Acidimicrobiia bacterium]